MAVIRTIKNANYTTMSNYHLKDKKMSLKAKGLLSVMLSLPNEWHYSVKGLKGICKESENTINGVLKELEKNVYLIRRRKYVNGRISEWEYLIFETNANHDEELLHLKNEDIENEDVDFLDIESCDAYKYTNKSITKELNTKELNIYSREPKFEQEIDEIIQFLNEQARTHYRTNSKNTIKNIKARLKEGFTVNDFYTVIKKKCDEWLGTEFEKFLNPDTLFCQKHFEKYLNQRIVKKSEFEGGLPF